MLGKTWLSSTGQGWKLRLGLVVFGVSAASLVTAVAIGERSDVGFGLGMFVFALLFMVAFVWINVAIRCPFCGARIIWLILRTRSHHDSLYSAFHSLTSCPMCKRGFEKPSYSP